MRTLFFLLLFINVGFATYILLEPVAGGVQPVLELPPERVEPLPVPPATCLEWGNFVEADLERVETAIASHGLSDKITRQAIGTAPVYWVHMPPLRSKKHAERKIGELRRLGVTTYTLVQDDSKWNNAISMGFFEEIEDAQAFMAGLRSKGVRSAIIGARNLQHVKFVVREPSDTVSHKITELKQEFPGSKVEKTQCEQVE